MSQSASPFESAEDVQPSQSSHLKQMSKVQSILRHGYTKPCMFSLTLISWIMCGHQSLNTPYFKQVEMQNVHNLESPGAGLSTTALVICGDTLICSVGHELVKKTMGHDPM